MWTNFQNSFDDWFVRKFSMKHHRDFYITCNIFLQHLVRFEIPENVTDFDSNPQQTVDMFLWTLWNLMQHLTVVRQTVSRLLTLIDGVTNILKFVRWRLESFERCCIVVNFSPDHLRTIFTARRVCIARTIPSQDVRLSARPSVRPSVCPSVCHTPVLSLNGYIYLQSFFTIW